MTPTTAPRKTVNAAGSALNPIAALLPPPEPAEADAEDVEDAPLAEELTATVGTPTAVMEPVKGPGPADAEAPCPTRNPMPCYIISSTLECTIWRKLRLSLTPDGPVRLLALSWKASKVLLPVIGALMALRCDYVRWMVISWREMLHTQPFQHHSGEKSLAVCSRTRWLEKKIASILRLRFSRKSYLRFWSLVTVKFHVGNPEVVFAGMNTQPESNPLARGSQGSLNDDCVTLWFPGLRQKVNDDVPPYTVIRTLRRIRMW